MTATERVIFIEWNHDGTVHQIVVTDTDEARYFDYYDVNWHEEQGYIHKSGGGPGPEVFLCGKVEGFRGKVWAAPEVSFTRWEGVDCHGHEAPLAREDVGSIGYDLVEEFPGDMRRDFIESDGYCCEPCDTWIPYDDPCQHDDPDLG